MLNVFTMLNEKIQLNESIHLYIQIKCQWKYSSIISVN